MMILNPTKTKHFAAMILIGDGVMALVHPQKDANAWKVGPKFWRKAMRELSKRPGLTRAIGAAQVVGGVLWALHQEED
jgi:hypothetical protein